MLNILIFGPPGSGKGTQSLNIIKKYNLIHFSTGNIFREEIKKQSKVGILAKKYIDKGCLVPDKIVVDIISKNINSKNETKGFVFDGFPRTLRQAEFFDDFMNKRNTPVSLVISIEVEEQELYNRILHRAKDSDRSDDNLKIIKNRIKVYKKQTEPLIKYFKAQDKYCPVNGMADIDTVFNRITNVIDNYIENK